MYSSGIYINKICLLDINLITEGETSEAFYFYTLPTTEPSDLTCETTIIAGISASDYYYNAAFSWQNPTTGISEDIAYQFSYNLVESMTHKFSS